MANTEPLYIEVFTGGLHNYAPPYKLSTAQFRSLKNLLPTPHGSLELREGQRAVLSNVSGSIYYTRAFARFSHPSGNRLVYHTAGDLTNDTNTFARDEEAGTDSLVNTLGIRQYSRPVLFDDKYIWIAQPPNGLTYPLVWDFYNSYTLGITPPSTATTITAFDAGNPPAGIPATESDPVYYYITFYDPVSGQESNPTTIAGVITPTNADYWPVSGRRTGITCLDLPTSAGKWRRIYRAGAGLPSPRLLRTIEDDSTTNFADQAQNVSLIDKPEAPFSHNPLPTDVDFTYLLQHGRRLFVFGESTVAISNINEPWYFPTTVTYPQTDGGIIVLDGDKANSIQAACRIGGGIWIGRFKDSWLLQGVDADSFTTDPILSIGCIAPLSLVSCGDVPVWLGPDRQVWSFNGKEPVMLSEPIKDMLRVATFSGARCATACYIRNGYEISIPYYSGQNGLYLRYDFGNQSWQDLSFRYTSARYLYAETGKRDGDETLIARGPYWSSPTGNTDPGIEAIHTSDITEIDFEATSGDLPLSGLGEQKRLTHVRVYGVLTPKAATIPTITFYAITELPDGAVTNTASFALYTKASPGLLLETDIPETIEGHRLFYSISGQASEMELDGIELSWTRIRSDLN